MLDASYISDDSLPIQVKTALEAYCFTESNNTNQLKDIKLLIIVSFPLVDAFTKNELAIKDILLDGLHIKKKYKDTVAHLKKDYDYLHY